MVRNQSRFLTEWLEYHMLIGIEHFIILINDPEPSKTKNVLQSYERQGIVKAIRYKANRTRHFGQSFNSVLPRLKRATKWCAFIDIDEFIYLPKEKLTDLLDEFNQYGALAMHWAVFGDSGLQHTPPLVTESFCWRAKDLSECNRHTKLISQVKYLQRFPTTHWASHDLPVVDEKQQKIQDKWGDDRITIDRIRLNHYTLRSKEDLEKKKKLWWGIRWNEKKLAIWLKKNNRNEVFDNSMHKFLPLLKKHIAIRTKRFL